MPEVTDVLQSPRPEELTTVTELLKKVQRERQAYWPSPVDWRDEILYFLLPDRFSDGKEEDRELLTRQEIRDLRAAAGRPGWSWQDWAESGKRWQGGTIKGIESKLDYLKGLGVSTLWVGPIFKQRARLDTYHGYGIQDFLEVDPRFGSRQDLFDLVEAAHDKEMRVILDIIMNHSGDNWAYLSPDTLTASEPPYLPWPNYYGNPQDSLSARWKIQWRLEEQTALSDNAAAINDRNQGVWPREFQNPERYTRAGKGKLGHGSIDDPQAEHKRTDFYSLKDFALDVGPTLSFLADCFKYWIAITDCDGFRIDTVKHVPWEEARNFCGALREFADSIGKRNFLLLGEIAGGDSTQDFYLDRLAVLQRNMTAALDIGEARVTLSNVGKGLQPGTTYFNTYNAEDEGFGSHRTRGNRHASILNDHDHVFGDKVRFSSEIPDHLAVKDYQIVAATAFQLFSLGIPCLYYGSEQAFAGPAHSELHHLKDLGWNTPNNFGDRYLREAMFGPLHPRGKHEGDLPSQLNTRDNSLPGFGPFGTAGKHCFDPQSPAYIRLAALMNVRNAYSTLRIGRQYPRQTRLPGTGFVFQPQGELVAWSRILDYQEAIIVVNPNGASKRGSDVVVSSELCDPGDMFTVVANTAQTALQDNYAGTHLIGAPCVVKSEGSGPSFIEIRDVPPAEVLVLIKQY